jgi:hypothetical protein
MNMTASTNGWTCPNCGRLFARRQSHECAPAMELEEYLATGPPFERPVFEAIISHLEGEGPVYVEPVSVGLFLKYPTGEKFAELRPMVKWMTLILRMPRVVHDRRITRKPVPAGAWVWHYVKLASADDVDDTVRDWLTEAYATT